MRRQYGQAMRLLFAILGTVAAGVLSPAGPVYAAPPGDDNAFGDEILSYPLADGDYSTPDGSNYGWVFFTTPDGIGCGLAPNGGPAGCDAVPSDAPAGTNQTVATSWAAGQYRKSDTATFTRNAAVLPQGRRVQTLGGACAVDEQGAVHCESGSHGFILSPDHGVLW
jgi:hypothetical protein